MDYLKKKMTKFGRKISAKKSLSSQDALENTKITDLDIYQPAPQKIIREAIVIKHEDNRSRALDGVVLETSGADETATVYGKPIQNDLAIRFESIAISGLSSERRKDLLQVHLPPVNCKLIDAPYLNPELKSSITDTVTRRDKAIYNKQKQLSSAISCLGEAITLLLSNDIKDPTVLRLLMDTGYILCDSQHNDSVTRRNYVLAVLKGNLKERALDTKINCMLFGKGLIPTLKTSKELRKSSGDLKVRFSFVNKSKPGSSKRNSNAKFQNQINPNTTRTKVPITEYVVEKQGHNLKDSPRSSKQTRKIDCWQNERPIKESRPSNSSGPQRR